MSWKRFTVQETAEILINGVPLTIVDGNLNVNSTVIGSNSVPYTTGALTVNEENIETPELYNSGNLNIISGDGNITLNPDGNTIINSPNFNGYELLNIGSPNQNNSAVTKSYVDTQLSGVSSPLKVQTFISNGNILTLNTTTQTLLTAVSGKVFKIISIRFFTYPNLVCSGNLIFYNGTTPVNWTLPATVMTCSSTNNISFGYPSGGLSTVVNTDFKVGASSAFSGSGTTYFTILYTLSDATSTYD
jgi:hypothetical protein